MAKEFLTSEEAADYIRISRRTLEHWRVRGGGPKYYKLGSAKRSRVLYTREDMEDWLEPRYHTAMVFEAHTRR